MATAEAANEWSSESEPLSAVTSFTFLISCQFFFPQMKTLYLGVYGSAGGGGMWRSWRAEFLVGVPEGVAEPLPGLLVG